MRIVVRVGYVFVGMAIFVGCAGVYKGEPRPLAFQDNLVAALADKYSKPGAIPINNVTIEIRNQVLNDMIYLTDVNFHRFTAELYQGRALFDTTGDLAILGLGAAGALTPAAATKAILAAVSGGLGGARISINKNFFHEQATTALIAKMEASRKTKFAFIQEVMKLSITDYPLSRGLSDVAEYYNAGTIIGALNEITASAGVEKAKAQDEIKTMISTTYQTDDATTDLRLFWKPDNGAINKDNEGKLIQWMQANGLSDVSITIFLRSKEYALQRRKAVQALIKNNP